MIHSRIVHTTGYDDDVLKLFYDTFVLSVGMNFRLKKN